ncbi:cyclic nucleotide-binding domain-containing protein [Erythrobacter sp. NAP1]|uniref:cyclic nucleotide-binding domain-containing protein n=1 Tax=Erythrobacter sp. NAP1 TaxID=237727 RepID=UPI000303457B|nr:cyclic nucleotide-binding domain-containing protein [Erythrobacter sp. NAP1]
MTLFDPAWLIHVGTALLLIGYFIRDELKLRVMIIVSSAVFNFYYWLVPDPPLWDAVLTGFLMIGVNLWVLSQVLMDRTTFRLSADERHLFSMLGSLTPGQFRRLMRIGRWSAQEDTEPRALTREGQPTDRLYYIVDGEAAVGKQAQTFALPEGHFIGEIAYVRDSAATADVWAKQGARLVEWDVRELRALGEKYPALGNAVAALLTKDMADKLAVSYRGNAPAPA